MDTKQFLEHILPTEGEYIIFVKDTLKHYSGTLDEICDRIRTADVHNQTVYHACSSFVHAGTRTQQAVSHVRAFWLDLDSSEGLGQAEHLRSLKSFLDTTILPVPTIVGSGNGIHVYWTLDQNISRPTWEVTAKLLRAATRKFGLQVDTKRTTDSASLLRPVGTMNRKNPDAPKPVKLLKLGQPTSHESFREKLKAYLGDEAFEIETPEAVNPSRAINDDLFLERDPLQSVSSERMASVCRQLDYFRRVQGDVPEPFWFGSLGVLAYTDDGETKAQEWSSGHPGYSYGETAAKLEHARRQSGMTSCETLYNTSPQPDLCKGCPIFGQCKTPRTMDFKTVKPASIVTAAPEGSLDDLFAATNSQVSQAPIHVPDCYLIAHDDDVDSVYVWKGDESWYDASQSEKTSRNNYSRVIRGNLYSDGYILDKNDSYTMKLVYLYGPNNSKRKELVVPGKTITNTRELMSILGEKGISSLGLSERHLSDYLRSYMQYHQTLAQQSGMYTHFGWHGDDFLVGTTLYKSDGTIEKVALGRAITDRAHIVEPKGDLDEWKKIINTAYNHPGAEPLQFAVLAGFAAPLMAHFQNFGGLTLHLYSQGSGKGKTTAARAALSVWGNPDAMQLTDKQATVNAIFATMGMYHSLPILYDEVTNKADDEIADLVHVVSAGQPKQRCDASGRVIENEHFWKTLVLTSGNKLLSDKMRSTRDNVEAEMARIFEVFVNVKPHISSGEAINLFAGLSNNYGEAGREFITYVVKNKAIVDKSLDEALNAIGNKLSMSQSERYWTVMLSSILVAHNICVKLGLVQFDRPRLASWLKDTLRLNRNSMIEVTPTTEDSWGRMLMELWQDVLVTEGEGSFIGGHWAEVVHHPKAKIAGRCVMDSRNPSNNRVSLAAESVRKWCQKNGKNYKEFNTELLQNKLISANVTRQSLGKGSQEYDSLPEVETIHLTKATVASMMSGGKFEIVPGGKKETA